MCKDTIGFSLWSFNFFTSKELVLSLALPRGGDPQKRGEEVQTLQHELLVKKLKLHAAEAGGVFFCSTDL